MARAWLFLDEENQPVRAMAQGQRKPNAYIGSMGFIPSNFLKTGDAVSRNSGVVAWVMSRRRSGKSSEDIPKYLD